MNKTEKKYIWLASGGTGGHIFPAKALSSVLLERGYQVVFITDKRQSFVSDDRYVLRKLAVLPLAGNALHMAKAMMALVVSIVQVGIIYLTYKPSVLVAFGGYPTLPSLLFAKWMKIPIIIHEQNSVLGKVNRRMAKHVNYIATAYRTIQKIPAACKPKMVLVGNPVRKTIQLLQASPYAVGKSSDPTLNVLVLGGSQGAKILSDVVPQALEQLEPHYRKRIHMVQQCRPEDMERVEERYQKIKVDATIAPFFTDIETKIRQAHLIISRAGASSLAEFTVVGRAMILVPLKTASDNHQWFNAMELQQNHAAEVIHQDSFKAEVLAKLLMQYLDKPSLLDQMALCAVKAGIVDADKRLADLVASTARMS